MCRAKIPLCRGHHRSRNEQYIHDFPHCQGFQSSCVLWVLLVLTVYSVTLPKYCPRLEPRYVRTYAQIDEAKTAAKRAFEPIMCPQVQIGRNNVSASAISISTDNPTIG